MDCVRPILAGLAAAAIAILLMRAGRKPSPREEGRHHIRYSAVPRMPTVAQQIREEDLERVRDEMVRRSRKLTRWALLQIAMILGLAFAVLHVQTTFADRYFGLTVAEVEFTNILMVLVILGLGTAVGVRKISREIREAKKLGLVCPYCDRAWIGRELDHVLAKRTCFGCGRVVLHRTT